MARSAKGRNGTRSIVGGILAFGVLVSAGPIAQDYDERPAERPPLEQAPSQLPAESAEEAARFSSGTNLVVLHARVKDRRGRYVSELPETAFAVFEDNVAQSLNLFTNEDLPATVGLLIDNSVSMMYIRDLVISAAVQFAKASNPEDEVFALAFNDFVHSALPPSTLFTSDSDVLRRALTESITARGKTALFDAVSDGLAYVARGSHPRRVLVILSDGGDNASHTTLQAVLRQTQASNVVIYAVVIRDPVTAEANPRILKQLAEASGGETFEPQTAARVATALEQVAVDIRRTYTLGYAPVRPPDGTLRRLRVEVNVPRERLTVRTRSGYLSEAAPFSAVPLPGDTRDARKGANPSAEETHAR